MEKPSSENVLEVLQQSLETHEEAFAKAWGEILTAASPALSEEDLLKGQSRRSTYGSAEELLKADPTKFRVKLSDLCRKLSQAELFNCAAFQKALDAHQNPFMPQKPDMGIYWSSVFETMKRHQQGEKPDFQEIFGNNIPRPVPTEGLYAALLALKDAHEMVSHVNKQIRAIRGAYRS